MNCVKSSQKHGCKDTNNLVNFCHPPLNCVKKPKYVHRIRDSSQKRGWNGHKKNVRRNQGDWGTRGTGTCLTGTCLNRATIVWLISFYNKVEELGWKNLIKNKKKARKFGSYK